MGHRRRITLRCLTEDLTDDWDDTAQRREYLELRRTLRAEARDSDIARHLDRVPTTSLAAHPLATSFFTAFKSNDGEVQRESISGLTDPHWWKQKSTRWRGAATDSHVVGNGEVWLCAGGIRSAGDKRDFYRSFTETIHRDGPNSYLPATEDRRLQDVEQKIARRATWLDQIRLAALVCAHACAREGAPLVQHLHAPEPDHTGAPIAHVEFEVVTVRDDEEELAELLLTVRDADWSRPNLLEAAVTAMRTAVDPVNDAWNVLPGAGDAQVWSVLLSENALRAAADIAESGCLPADFPNRNPRLGVHAHYTRRDGIVDATVDGDAVEALCGKWFVPTTIPDEKPVCQVCRQTHESLPD